MIFYNNVHIFIMNDRQTSNPYLGLLILIVQFLVGQNIYGRTD